MTKFFTLIEAQNLLPVLREIVEEAHIELSTFHIHLQHANEEYLKAEGNLDQSLELESTEAIKHLRSQRREFQKSIEALNLVQQKYLERFNYWVEKINEHGVILRDLKEGLFDFPARQGNLSYLLCWQIDEADITYWHLPNDGFVGRRSLTSLLEYC